ncbi:MAG: cbb3-type cytochrome oxidase assembly protein CcoS [Pseudomonadota bacterium]
MEILIVLVPISLLLIGCALWIFNWAVDNGQFEDLEQHGLDLFNDSEDT